MTRRIVAVDENNPLGPFFYNIAPWADRTRLSQDDQAMGTVTDFSIFVLGELNGTLIPALPDVGWLIVDYDKDFYGAGLHKYYGTGVVVQPIGTPTAGSQWQEIQVAGFELQMAMPVPFIEFDQPTYPTEGSRVQKLISDATGLYGLKGSWDAITNVQTGAISYPAVGNAGYNHQNVYDILEQLRVDVGQSTDAGYPEPARFWYVRGEWQDPINPETLGVQRTLYYYSSRLVAREPIPLTDRSDGMAYYAYDDMIRANSTTAVGTAETGQAWSALIGTWGINGDHAYLASAGSGEDAVVLDASVGDGEVAVVLPAVAAGQRLLFRVISNTSWSYKWSGWAIENSGGAAYKLRKYVAGVWSDVATYPITPRTNDTLKVVLKGTSITPYINGSAKTPVTDAFNQTATLHGLGTPATSVARWGLFTVWAKGATYSELTYPKDGTGVINILPIEGPGAEPTPVTWQHLSGVAGANDGDLSKTLTAPVWQAAHVYSTSDKVSSSNQNDGFFELDGAGGTSGGSEPTWNNTEGATTADSGLVWTRRNWNAGATSKQILTDDGGYVAAIIEAVTKVQDDFTKPDNSATMGSASSNQSWATLGTNALWGILAHQAYPVSGTAPHYADIDSGVSTCIVQVTFASLAVGQRLLFRARDASNLWYVEAQASSYKIFKRVAGSDTLMATLAVTPVVGDVIKVSLEGSTIKLYRNGTLGTTVADTFNQGATLHGFGTAGDLSVRFTNFSVWQTDENVAFGLGPLQDITSYAQIPFAWKMTSGRTCQPYESGVAVASAASYADGDTFKVEVRPVQNGSHLQFVVRYYHNGVLAWISGSHPTLSEATPYYAQGALYDRGATISNATIRRFTYGIYQDDASVAAYGPRPAKKTLVREDLDTQAKRVAYKEAFFSRHAQPRGPATLKTLQEYTAGRLVLINNSRFSWVNRLVMLPTVKRDWGQSGSSNLKRPEYQLTVGDSEVEWGDDVPAGFLLKNALNIKTDPTYPTSFAATPGVEDSATTVSEVFSWVSREGDRFAEIQLRPVGGAAKDPVPFPASAQQGTIGSLPPATPYTARIRSRNYSNQASDWSPSIPFTTPAIGAPDTPTNLRLDTRDGGPGYGTQAPTQEVGASLNGWISLRWDVPTFLPDYWTLESWYIDSFGDVVDYHIDQILPGRDYARLANKAVGVQYQFVLKAWRSGLPSLGYALFQWTITSWTLVQQDAGTTFGVDYTNINLSNYSYALGVGPAGGTVIIHDAIMAAVAGAWYRFWEQHEASSAAGTFSYWVEWLNAAGAIIGGSPTLLYSGTPTVSFVPHQGPVQAPAGTVRARKRLGFNRGAGVGTVTLYVSEPVLAISADNDAIAPGLDPGKLSGAINNTNNSIAFVMTNNSGAGVVAGDVVVMDATLGSGFKTTTTAGLTTFWVGVALETIANAASGKVAVYGYVPLINTGGASAGIGDYFLTSSTAKVASHTPSLVDGVFARALTSGVNPPAMLTGGLPRIGYLLPASSLSDVVSMVSARQNIGLGGISIKTADFSPTGNISEPGIYLVNCAGGPVRMNLPSIAQFTEWAYVVVKIDNTANQVIIDPYQNQTINWNYAKRLTVQSQACAFTPDLTSNWNIFAEAAGGLPFTPLSISGCKLWLPHDILSGIDGSSVSSDVDQSGLGNTLTQGTTANKPVLKTGANGQNGGNIVRFDGTNDYLNLSTFSALKSVTSFSMFLVFKTTDVTSNRGVMWSGNDDMRVQLLSSNIYAGAAGGYGHVAYSDVTNFHVWSLVYDGTQSTDALKFKLYKDGVQQTLSFDAGIGTATSATNGFWEGADKGLAVFHLGDIAEILVYTPKLSTTDQATVEQYLRDKWGI